MKIIEPSKIVRRDPWFFNDVISQLADVAEFCFGNGAEGVAMLLKPVKEKPIIYHGCTLYWDNPDDKSFWKALPERIKANIDWEVYRK